MVQKDQEHTRQNILQKLHAAKKAIQFKMTLPNKRKKNSDRQIYSFQMLIQKKKKKIMLLASFKHPYSVCWCRIGLLQATLPDPECAL